MRKRKNEDKNIVEHPIDLCKTLVHNGPKFRSHTIIFGENSSYLKPTISSMLFCFVYVVVGIGLLGIAINVYVKSQQLDLAIFVGGFGIAIFTFGITLLKPFMKHVIFDKNTGRFINNTDRRVKLENIISLQINNKIIKSKHGLSYPCYELNMLTKNGRRINILNHNDIEQLTTDANSLSKFLEVELFDLQREIRVEV